MAHADDRQLMSEHIPHVYQEMLVEVQFKQIDPMCTKQIDTLEKKRGQTGLDGGFSEELTPVESQPESVERSTIPPKQDMYARRIALWRDVERQRLAIHAIWSNARMPGSDHGWWEELLIRGYERCSTAASCRAGAAPFSFKPDDPEFSLAVACCLIFGPRALPPPESVCGALLDSLHRYGKQARVLNACHATLDEFAAAAVARLPAEGKLSEDELSLPSLLGVQPCDRLAWWLVLDSLSRHPSFCSAWKDAYGQDLGAPAGPDVSAEMVNILRDGPLDERSPDRLADVLYRRLRKRVNTIRNGRRRVKSAMPAMPNPGGLQTTVADPKALLWTSPHLRVPEFLLAVLFFWRPTEGFSADIESDLETYIALGDRSGNPLKEAVYESVFLTVDKILSVLHFLFDLQNESVESWTELAYNIFVDDVEHYGSALERDGVDEYIQARLSNHLVNWDPARSTLGMFTRQAVTGNHPNVSFGNIPYGVLGNQFRVCYGLESKNLAHYVCENGHEIWYENEFCPECRAVIGSDPKVVIKERLILNCESKGFREATCWKCEECQGYHKLDAGGKIGSAPANDGTTNCPHCRLDSRVDKRKITRVFFYKRPLSPDGNPDADRISADDPDDDRVSEFEAMLKSKDEELGRDLQADLPPSDFAIYQATVEILRKGSLSKQIPYLQIAEAVESFEVTADDVKNALLTILKLIESRTQESRAQNDGAGATEADSRREDSDDERVPEAGPHDEFDNSL